MWAKYYHLVDEADYTQYDSKSAFLIRNKVVREKMEFFMYYHQHMYYKSDFYNNRIRKFECGDTLHLRFNELQAQFEPRYARLQNVRP